MNNNNQRSNIVKATFVAMVAGSILTLTSCDSAKQEYDESLDQASNTEFSESIQQVPADYLSEDESSPELNADNGLIVDSLDNSTDNILGSQTSDLKIKGKQLLVSANASFKVDDVVATRNTIESLTRQHKGYIASSTIQSNVVSRRTFTQLDKDISLVTYYRQANMLVRIPKQEVSDFLNKVQAQVKFLNNQQFTAKDVTLDLYREQLQAQLNSEMAGELTQQRLDSNNEKEQTSNIDSIRATYSAKQRKQMAELEKMRIADQVKYSTIELTFTQPNSIYKETTDSIEYMLATEQPGFWLQAKQSIVEGWQMIKAFVLGIIGLWWLWALFVIGFGLYLLIKRFLKRFNKHKPTQNPYSNKVKPNDDLDNS